MSRKWDGCDSGRYINVRRNQSGFESMFNDLLELISLQIFQATYFNDNIQRLADFVALFCIAIFLLSAFKNFYNK